jgi:glutaredoxin
MAKFVMWVGSNCPKCDEVKSLLLGKGHEVEERPAVGLTNGDEFNPQALKLLAKQNYATPLVFSDDRHVDVSSLA